MDENLPIILVPGLNCTARLYRAQIEALWPHGQVTVADHRRDTEIKATAARILSNAPPRFALAGFSFGGYIAFEMTRQASGRIAKLALLDTSARPDTPEQTAIRKTQIAMAQSGRYGEIPDLVIPLVLHPDRQSDPEITRIVRQISEETGPEASVRELEAIMSRPDSRPLLPSIRCPTLVLVGESDLVTPPELHQEIAGGITNARLVIVPNSGHLSPIERPEPVSTALAQWPDS
jgi:pimeloyl-ACP methyl ester carboxylesterase